MGKGTAKLTAPTIASRKVRDGNEPLVMVTAYDTPSARIISAAGADILLVGDSLAMVVLGYEDTLQVSVADMCHHTAAVARARTDCHIVADMPWLSYHVSTQDTVRNAASLIRAGAHSVKLEGGRKRLPMIERILAAEIPVMAHIGLTPQSIHQMGGFKVQATQSEHARKLLQAAKSLAHAGCFALVLEGVPLRVAELITEAIDIPTIGIGAGPSCDGQVLVFHDLLGLEDRVVPKFVRRYAELKKASVAAVAEFAKDVRSGAFPSVAESYQLTHFDDDELQVLGSD